MSVDQALAYYVVDCNKVFKNVGDDVLKKIAEEISAFEEVIYLVLLTGSHDLHIEVVCRDSDHLLTFLTKKLHAVAGVKEAETFMYLKIAKENYGWAGNKGAGK